MLLGRIRSTPWPAEAPLCRTCRDTAVGPLASGAFGWRDAVALRDGYRRHHLPLAVGRVLPSSKDS